MLTKPHRSPSYETRSLIAPKAEPSVSQASGLLIMDALLNPISCNYETIRILSYPNAPENIEHLDVFLAQAIRTRLVSRRAIPHSHFVKELVSGKRRYRCAVFRLNWHIRATSYPDVELLLDRSVPGLLFLPRIAQQFNLSPREQQVVELLSQGLSSKEIANRMNISSHTVNTFFRLIMIKMGVSSRYAILAKMIARNFNDG
jgi:DNA-binding CsgD family transcriptional regulator